MHRLNRGSFEKPLLSQIETMTRTGNAQNWTLDNRPSVCHWIGGSINMSFVIKQTGETGDRYQPVSKIATTLINPKILPPTTIMNHATLICLP